MHDGNRRYSDSQKHESSCLLSDRFWCISPEPFELQKNFLPLLASIFEELSDKKIIFFSSSGSGDIHEKQSLNKQLDSCFCESLYVIPWMFFFGGQCKWIWMGFG